MSQALTVNLRTAQLWPQGDIRDPLGVWGARLSVAGTAGAGEIKVGITVPEAERAADIFTCYSVTAAVLLAAGSVPLRAHCRLLTNWPDIDPTAGVQGYSSGIDLPLALSDGITAPEGQPTGFLVSSNQRFLLLFDPRPQPAGPLTIVEIKINAQIENDTYAFEAYGYYWDRSVLQAPGGLRHPGSA